MGRVNKFTEGVFTDIVGNQSQTPAYDRFVSIQDLLKKPSAQLKKYLNMYKKGIVQNKPIFETLGKLEDIIMQMRTRDNLTNEDVKLNVVREYIYARVPFFRNDKETKDIRVIVGGTEEYGTDVDILLGNDTFMTKAKAKLIAAMDEVITQSAELVK